MPRSGPGPGPCCHPSTYPERCLVALHQLFHSFRGKIRGCFSIFAYSPRQRPSLLPQMRLQSFLAHASPSPARVRCCWLSTSSHAHPYVCSIFAWQGIGIFPRKLPCYACLRFCRPSWRHREAGFLVTREAGFLVTPQELPVVPVLQNISASFPYAGLSFGLNGNLSKI